MNDRWPIVNIEDIKAGKPNAIAMGPFGSRIKTDNFVADGVPVIRGNNLTGERLVEKNYVFLTEEKANELRSSSAYPGDIVITHRGTLGQIGLIPEKSKYPKYIVSQSQMKLTLNTNKADPTFVFYFLKSRYGQHQLLAAASQTGVPAIAQPTSTLKSIEVPLPPISEQRAISHILSTLDDKIELNRRMNETLEAIARAIFKSWFIDFDPVRAKSEGRDPGLPQPIADLFPDSFEASELGSIPVGWQVKPIGEAAICVGGSTPSTKEAAFWENGNIPFVTPKDMSQLGAPIILDTERSITELGAQRISSGVLPAGTVLLSSRAPIGYLAITTLPISINQGIIALICDGLLPRGYIFGWIEANMARIKASAGGTTFAEISKGNFRKIQAIIPTEETLSKYTSIFESLFEAIINNEKESKMLISIRDTLLLKLISGDIRIKNAEGFVSG